MADGYTYLGDIFIGQSYEKKRKYFTIEALASGTLYINRSDVLCSIDGGSWQQPMLLSITAGQNIELKGTTVTGGTFNAAMLPSCKISGNVNSLFYGDSFKDMDVIPTYMPTEAQFVGTTRSAYIQLFSGNTAIVDASELYIPSSEDFTPYANAEFFGAYYQMFEGCTNLTAAPKLHDALSNFCYCQMFYGCTGLTEAPELPATTLVSNCYYRMFRYCSSLNYVKCLATNPQNSQYNDYTESWLDGVASSGTFVKPTSVTTWHRSDGGIPSAWTVQDI